MAITPPDLPHPLSLTVVQFLLEGEKVKASVQREESEAGGCTRTSDSPDTWPMHLEDQPHSGSELNLFVLG